MHVLLISLFNNFIFQFDQPFWNFFSNTIEKTNDSFFFSIEDFNIHHVIDSLTQSNNHWTVASPDIMSACPQKLQVILSLNVFKAI